MNISARPPLPDHIDGYGPVRPFRVGKPKSSGRSFQPVRFSHSLGEAVIASGIEDGATVSFHHHLRDGDDVMRAVMDVIAELGLRDIHVAAVSIFPVHAPLVEHIRSGVISRISAGYVSGPVARAISDGELRYPAVLQTHGGRARAIATGELPIDAAFIAAPSVDGHGNITGAIGPAACGPLGYAMVDARFAKHVVAITDNLLDEELTLIDISGSEVDQVVIVPSIGDASRIVSGTTRMTDDPASLRIAAMAARVTEASGLRTRFLLPDRRRRYLAGGCFRTGHPHALPRHQRGGCCRRNHWRSGRHVARRFVRHVV